jgi:hypothetical protein
VLVASARPNPLAAARACLDDTRSSASFESPTPAERLLDEKGSAQHQAAWVGENSRRCTANKPGLIQV